MRKTLYKEDTNVLSYYVLTLVLMNNYQDFLSWCNINNIAILNFKKTTKNLDEFCKFIEKKYKTKNMLEGVECTEKLLHVVKNSKRKQKDMLYLLKNLRMTICELG
jgi:N-glycosylase/DNA lyase